METVEKINRRAIMTLRRLVNPAECREKSLLGSEGDYGVTSALQATPGARSASLLKSSRHEVRRAS
jgi:hypothetical protein